MTRRFMLAVSLAAVSGCTSTRTPMAETRAATAQPGSNMIVVSRAEEILGGSVSPADWRPALWADLQQHLEQIGALGPANAPSHVRNLLNDLSAMTRIAPAQPADSVEGVVLVGPTISATRAHRILVVCREGEFDVLDSSVVVCLGDLRARTVRNCVLFVRGRTEADQIDTATICGGGRLDARMTRDTALIAGAGTGQVGSPSG